METTIRVEPMASAPGFYRVVEVGPTGFLVLHELVSHARAILLARKARGQ